MLEQVLRITFLVCLAVSATYAATLPAGFTEIRYFARHCVLTVIARDARLPADFLQSNDGAVSAEFRRKVFLRKVV